MPLLMEEGRCGRFQCGRDALVPSLGGDRLVENDEPPMVMNEASARREPIAGANGRALGQSPAVSTGRAARTAAPSEVGL
ncbi:hypothetical protein [Nucisporomicrobium flavum]|uniref:hypothetical protein n=1 Tax=Nucisporomicrobium flavum TaxID=2785915 RepID=UPI0018F2AEB0|nr:hypothetical protein [Nucisporomicrobium flavum]